MTENICIITLAILMKRLDLSASPWKQVIDANLLPHLISGDESSTRLGKIAFIMNPISISNLQVNN